MKGSFLLWLFSLLGRKKGAMCCIYRFAGFQSGSFTADDTLFRLYAPLSGHPSLGVSSWFLFLRFRFFASCILRLNARYIQLGYLHSEHICYAWNLVGAVNDCELVYEDIFVL